MTREKIGNFAKRRKIREFPFNYIVIKKEKLLNPLLPFFPGKKNKTLLCYIFNNLQNISPKVYFLGGRIQV